MSMIAMEGGRYAISSDIGQLAELWVIRIEDGKGVSHLEYLARRRGSQADTVGPEQPSGSTRPSAARRTGLYYGLASSGTTVYAAMGAADEIAVLTISEDGTLTRNGTIVCHAGDFPAGLAVDGHGHLFVANNTAGTGTGGLTPASMAVYDCQTRRELGRFVFGASYYGTSNFPYAIAATQDGSRCFVASERDGIVYVLDTTDPSRILPRAGLATGSHPIALTFSPDGGRLYVANAGSDTISAIDVRQEKVVDTLLLRPPAAHALPGATPTGIATSGDGKTVFVTLSDMNAVAVIDAQKMTLLGYLPTGWYPSGVVASADGKRLLVANAKGTSAAYPRFPPVITVGQTGRGTGRRGGAATAPATMPRRSRATSAPTTIVDPNRLGTRTNEMIVGNVMSIELPDAKALATMTQRVLTDACLSSIGAPPPAVFAHVGPAVGRIKHVVYVIKENRSYDQVLGDERLGDGDKDLVIFGKEVTPNQHALAERFVLLDNTYACGEVSGDGWVWSTQGMANPYVIRNVPYYYSNRGRAYDFEGQNNEYIVGGMPARDPDGRVMSTQPAMANGLPPVPDVAESGGGHFWDAAARAGVSYRNWGMYLSMAGKGIPENYPTVPGLSPAGHDLAGRSDWDYRKFDLDYADSDAGTTWFAQTGDENCLDSRRTYGRAASTSRFAEWKREFDMMLARDPSGGAVPQLMLIRMPDDHTSALSPGHHSPRSAVADNDYAIGQLVEAISHSPIWPNTAIFIVEDDAQNGNDHIDVHRMPAYVISPWIKRHSVDHRFYNTDSVLKTMEILLNVGPMTQYDAVAAPIDDFEDAPAGTGPLNGEPFDATLPSKDLIAEMNPRREALAPDDPRLPLVEASASWDFSRADHAPTDEMNLVIWKSIKGFDVPMPPPRHTLEPVTGATLSGATPAKKAKDDDDDD
jgi:YVTN family beta-propeller protein